MDEDHQDLIVDLGQQVRAALGPAHRHHHPRPVGLVVAGEPGELQLDQERSGLVLVLDDDREVDPADLVGALGRLLEVVLVDHGRLS
ncbi:MAG: hypothetical protein HS111_31540 [Kofleriaceae bacterium]|nr:hypothetical protein [Kofleriaceae bacterium]